MGRGAPSLGSSSQLSLGTVGGPRGVGAGSIRALLQFVTTYDRGALEKLEADLQTLKQTQISTQTALQQQLAKRITLERNIQKAQASQLVVNKDAQEALKAYNAARAKAQAEIITTGKRSAATIKEINDYAAEFVRLSTTSGNLTQTQAQRALRLLDYQRQLELTQERINALGQADIGIQGEIADKMTLQQRIQARGSQLRNAVGSLALGAIGGVVGGAVVGGLLLGPLQAGVDALGGKLQDLVDPAHNARDALKDVSDQVKDIANKENINNLAAAQKVIEGLGTVGRNLPGSTAGGLALAVKTENLKEALDQLDKVAQQGKTAEQLWNEQRDRGIQKMLFLSDTYNKIYKQVAAFGPLVNEAQIDNLVRFGQITAGEADQLRTLIAAARDEIDGYTTGAEKAAAATSDAADAAKALASYLEDAASQQIDAHLDQTISQINSFSDIAIGRLKASADADISAIRDRYQGQIDSAKANADARIRALQRRSQNLDGTSGRTESLQKQLEALNDTGPSKRTQELTDRLERLSKAQDRQNYLTRLAAANEALYLAKLRERLAASKQDIDISRFHGQARLVAIQAELELMARRNAEQEKFNKLLDIQYAISKGIERSQGESIQDFINRRAQFYRDQLQQAADLNNQTVSDALNAEKDRVENEIDLRDLAEKRKQVIADRAHDLFIKRLQAELDASKKADQDAVDARRKRLQQELEASRKADQDALEARRQAIADEITAIRAATDNHIKEIERERDTAIDARQRQLDFDLAKEQQATDNLIKQAKARADAAKQWASVANADQKALAIQGAQDLAMVNAIAGRAAGSAFAYEQLKAELEASGITGPELQLALANIAKIRTAAQNQIDSLTRSKAAYYGQGYAKGGFFEITNGMNFGRNIRAGEEGNEGGWSDGRLGAIIPHKMWESMKGARSGPVVEGGITINRSDDPYRDAHRFRRQVEDIVDQRLARGS